MKIHTKTALIIVATLVIGIFIGALGSGFMFHRRTGRPPRREYGERFVEFVMDLIAPPAEQEDEIREILTRHAEEYEEITKNYREETSALFDSLGSRLDSVLTDEQKAKFEERRRRLRQRMDHGKPLPHGKPGDHRPPPPPDEGGE